MIVIIFLLIIFIGMFAFRFTTLEGRKQNKHKEMKEAKKNTFRAGR